MGLAGVAIGTANQVPQLIELIAKYRKAALGVTAAAATFGSYMSYSWMREQMDDSDESPIGQRRIRNVRANQTKRWNAERAKLRTDGTVAGEAESVSHSMMGRDFDVDASLRASQSTIESAAADQARQNERAAMLADTSLTAVERIEKIAALDKKHLADRSAAVRQALDEELRLAQAEEATVQKRKEALTLLMMSEKERIDLGRMATDAEIKAVAAAKAEVEGLDERMKAAQSRLTQLEQRSKLLNLSERTVRPVEEAGIDAQAKRDTEAATEEKIQKTADDFVSAGRTFVKAMWSIAEDIPRVGKARTDREKEMQILELRSRGQNRKADRLERQSDIESRAEALEKGPEKMEREKALKEAEREYDLRNPSGRIRGAGFGGSRGGRRSATEFTGIDGGIGGGIDGTGGLDGLSRLNSRNRRVGESADGRPAFAGLDGLDALQNQNRKIRGAGFKAERQTKETDAQAGQQQAGGGAGPLTAILNAISGVGRKVEALTSASRTIRR